LLGIARLGLAELSQIEGVGVAKATQLQAALDLSERVTWEVLGERPQVKTPAEAAAFLMRYLVLSEQERLRTLLLDARSRVMGVHEVYQGNLNSITIRPSEVFREAVKRNSASIIVAHNHPSTDPIPSPEDLASTRQLIAAGKVLGIEVVDHLIFGGPGRWVSLREHGLGFD
jgi:DNA repair protein RadC